MRLFVVGAGASAAAPARLPVFAVLRGYLLDRLQLSASSAGLAELLAPERFMQSIFDGGLPLAEWLSETLGQGRPNAVHHVLRRALDEGDTVWTMNVDELIERAWEEPPLVSSFDEVAPSPAARLLKPHGTLSRGRYIFRTDQVVRPLPTAWARRLRADGAGAHLVVVGYAGADLDMLTALDEVFAGAKSVTWFACHHDRDQIVQRFPSLRGTVRLLGGPGVDTLTPAFLDWADGEGLTAGVDPHLQELAKRPVALRDPALLPGDTRLAAALILERAGEVKAARRAYLRLACAPPRRRAFAALRRVRTIDLYAGATWTKPLFALAASPAAPVLPYAWRVGLDRAHLTRLGNEGDHKAAGRRVQRIADPKDPAVLLAEAKAARFRGRYAEAIRLSSRAEQYAAERTDVDLMAYSLYEQAFALTWSGQLQEARTVVNRLYATVDGLAGVRWVAWAAWQRACLALYTENDQDDPLEHLDRAEAIFQTDRTPTGLAAVRIVRLTALRRANADDEFEAALASIEPWRGQRGWTRYTDCSLDLEKAEFARTHSKDLAGAVVLYEKVIRHSPDEPVHRGVALLGLAEAQRATGRDNTVVLNRVRRLVGDYPIAYLAAHSCVAEYMAGQLDAEAALTRIETVAPQLPTRTRAKPLTPLDFCLGSHADQHELFFP